MGTVCRIKQNAVIVQQNEKQIEYRVVMAELGDQTGLEGTIHCPEYLEKLNQIAADGSLRYTLFKDDLRRLQ